MRKRRKMRRRKRGKMRRRKRRKMRRRDGRIMRRQRRRGSGGVVGGQMERWWRCGDVTAFRHDFPQIDESGRKR